MLRKWAAVTAAAAMLMSGPMAFADTGKQQPKQQQGALAPGNAAGVVKATGYDTNVLMIVLGVGVVIGGVALALSSSGGGSGSSSSAPSTH